MIRRSTTTICGFLLGASAILTAQNQKDMIIQMQRDMGLLQEQVRTMQRTQDEKFAAITENLRTTLDVVNRLNATLAVTQKDLNDKLGEVTRNVSSPMTNMGGKVDQMSDQFQGLSNSVADLSSRIGKLDARLAELQKMVQVIQTPPSAPPAGDAANNTPGGTNPASVASAQKIFEDANRDMLAGSFDLALQGFQDYLKNYGNTQQAADAQFYIGEVYFRRDDFENALKEYAKVIDSYPDSTRVADAYFKRGMSLVKLERKTAAKKEFQAVVDKFPGNPLVGRSKDYLKALGVNTTQAPAPKKSTSPTRKR